MKRFSEHGTEVVSTVGMGIEQKTFPTETWMERELAGCKFRDVRLEKRFRKLFEQLSGAPGESIPMVCQDWANTKAAYRFFSNERVSEADRKPATARGHRPDRTVSDRRFSDHA